ncbi:MAG: SIS domain-containing protein [Candidatus Hodarchaeota archaeon]
MARLRDYTWADLKNHFDFVREVFEQPDALKSLLDHYMGVNGKRELIELKEIWEKKNFNHVIFSGMGSSLFAGRIATLKLQSRGVPCSLTDSGELLYHGSLHKIKSTLFILTSQSGESIEIVKMLEKIPVEDTGNMVWGITNTEGSILARKARKCLLLKAGDEKSVTSKTFCNSLVLMHLLSKVLATSNINDLNSALKTAFIEIKDLIDAVEKLLDNNEKLGDRIVDFIEKDARAIEIIARGTSLASAEQMGLNIKETNKIPAEALSAGQFRHGPIEMIDKNFRSIILISDYKTRELDEEMAWNITHRWGGGKTVVITNKKSEKLEGEPRIMQIVHDIKNPFLAPVMEIIIVQLLMIKLASENDIEPGVFRYSSKITKEG